ncbi:MAG: hypothetical protein KatS3mg033_0138 [Thermonema sp.]|jgi:phosphoribosylanthranilate isomerase|uniref:phosphoribosylanthranilate isomerase n=1 Tax=Thermonema TaxID=28194 RepID=UPI00056EC249|nr:MULTISPECIES: hypothetical protein [Thermonema]GIV38338.1 MAG: hypothetical protein KatS3mg033_0138 [Thermonema sp.]
MGLKTFVKVSVNNLSDARYCAGMGVDMLGFCMEAENPNFVSPEKYFEIIGWLAGVEFVGEFHNYDLKQINKVLADYPVHGLQIDREDVLEELRQISINTDVHGLPVLFRLYLHAHMNLFTIEPLLEKYHKLVKMFVLESEVDRLTVAEMQQLKKLAEKYPILLGYGITPDNIQLLLSEVPLKGIALHGSDELRPGLKDFDELADILEAIEVD